MIPPPCGVQIGSPCRPGGIMRYPTSFFVFRRLYHLANLARTAEILRIQGALTQPGGTMAKKKEEQQAAPASSLADGVLVQVCVECGKEYFYDDTPPSAEQKCERCGNTVFRSFFDVTDGDEVVAD